MWGYGKLEKEFGHFFKSVIRDANLKFFIDHATGIIKDDNDRAIGSIEILKNLIENKTIDKIIMLADINGPAELRGFMQQCFIYGIDFREILFYTEVSWFLKVLGNKDVMSFKNCLEEAKRKVPIISNLEYEMVEFCNLNCKRCNHYSNIFTDGKLIDFETFRADMDMLSTLTCNIKRFKLLGGEPLLHPELHRFIEYSRKVFSRAPISIITNGFLIPKMNDVTIKAIKDTGTVVEISVYPPMKNQFVKIENLLQLHSIPYKIFRDGDKFGAYINAKGDSPKMRAMMQCYAQVCHSMKNGQLYKCTTAMNIHVLNKKFNVDFPSDSLKMSDIPKENAGEIITKYLLDTVDMCRFCTKFKYYDWQPTKNDAVIDDWIAN